MQPRSWSTNHPIWALVLSFAAWKILLILIALCSPGPGYDTSTNLLLSIHDEETERLPKALHYFISRLIRWDAIYFVKVANRGYLFEQEWAWGWGFTRSIALCTSAIKSVGVPQVDGLEGLVAIFLAHSAHFLSVLVLFKLTLTIFPASTRIAVVAASLHIISPAGLFLSAPYAESSCALLTFTGVLLFANSLGTRASSTVGQDLLVLLSGVVFGIATTFRSNGILNGLLLFEEAFRILFLLRDGIRLSAFRRLLATGLGGICVAAGFLLPQHIAYNEYCGNLGGTNSRPWCQKSLPSVYTFVQEHYWNVGLFRYWTLSNIPLFLLATPMTVIMILSGIWALKQTPSGIPKSNKGQKLMKYDTSEPERLQVLRNLAFSQLVLTMLTLTTAHVQIITRISSAYPVWMWCLAMSQKGALLGSSIGFIVMYTIIQAGLFASFLPPA